MIKMCGDMLISFNETDTKKWIDLSMILSEINVGSTACSFNIVLLTN